jgi:hypothetical protein
MGQVHYLPTLVKDQKALINEIARSSLFTVRDFRKPRWGIDSHLIYCVGKEKIAYTGVELRAADDEIVWELMLSYASEYQLGEWIQFTARQACLDLGWPVNSNQTFPG